MEKWECWLIDDRQQLDFIRNRNAWAMLQTIVMIRSQRQEGDKVTSLLKQERSTRRGIANKRLKAAWDDAYLLKVLQPG